MGVIAELAEDPGAEYGPEAGQAQIPFSVRVPAKMRSHHLPELGDLDVQDVDELHLAGHDRRVGVLHRPRLTQLFGLERLLDRGGSVVDVTTGGSA